ncbi:hypothetical protein DCC79_09550 [bacterium]|nr:hypothetical protein [Chloroflexi bacterium CFX6]RIL09926.1 MAG: hypothetical protein DCC79_09550 [bacterium]
MHCTSFSSACLRQATGSDAPSQRLTASSNCLAHRSSHDSGGAGFSHLAMHSLSAASALVRHSSGLPLVSHFLSCSS